MRIVGVGKGSGGSGGRIPAGEPVGAVVGAGGCVGADAGELAGVRVGKGV